MYRTIVRAGTCLCFAAIALAACDHDPRRPEGCTDLAFPGILVPDPPINVAIRDTLGRGQALGATVVVRHASGGLDSTVNTGSDTVHVRAGFPAAGSYSVTVHKPFYRDVSIASVTVNAGECTGAITTNVPVILRLLAGAPPVRSVGLLGGTVFLMAATDTAKLTAVVDADPGLTTAVSWRLADTTLATVSASGTVHARCTTLGGTDTVTAVSVADTTVRAKQSVVVAKQSTCP